MTPSELLAGQTAEAAPSPQADQAAQEALQYAQRRTARRRQLVRTVGFCIFSVLLVIAAVACLIPDLCISGALTWSRIVLASLVLAWLLALPLFWSAHPWRGCCAALTLTLVPYLWVLGLLIGQPLVLRMGGPIALVGLADLWLLYLLFSRLPFLRALGLWCLCNTPTVWLINKIVSLFVRQTTGDRTSMLINTAAMVGIALLCLLLDQLVTAVRRRGDREAP